MRLTDDDRATLREAALLLKEMAARSHTPMPAYLAGRLDGLAGRVPQVDNISRADR